MTTSGRWLGNSMLVLLLVLLLSNAVHASQVHYAVSVEGTELVVQAMVKNAPKEFELVFTTAAWGVTRLEQRIFNLEVDTVNEEPASVFHLGAGIIGIQLTQPSDLIVRYRVRPGIREWDHHLTTVTKNHLQLTTDILFRIRDLAVDERPLQPSGTLELVQLPESWIILPHQLHDEHGYFTLSDDLLIYAGIYHIRRISLGKSRFALAFNQEFELHLPLLFHMDTVLRYQYNLFGDYRAKEALVVLNPLPADVNNILYAGQAQPGLAVLYTRMNEDLQREPGLLLAYLAHETFHLWLAQSFALYEGVYWFTEGFTRYHEYQVLRDLQLVDAETVLRLLTEEWVATARVQRYTTVSLQEAGAHLFADPAYRILAYAKGALIAYLFEQQLPANALVNFYRDLYQYYAVEGKPIGNKEIVALMNEYLDNTRFTQRWILEPSRLSITDLPELQPFMFGAWLAVLPEVALDMLASNWGLLGLAMLCVVVVGMYFSTAPKSRS